MGRFYCSCFATVSVGSFCCENQLTMCSMLYNVYSNYHGFKLDSTETLDLCSLACLPLVRAPIGKTQNMVNG